MKRNLNEFHIILLIGLLEFVSAKSLTTYDQRQEGKINVQIDVKDLQIVALVDSDMLEDYTNYDYAYDYADFTIKPRPTPSKPTTTATTIGSTSGTTTTKTTTTTEIYSTKPSDNASTNSNATIDQSSTGSELASVIQNNTAVLIGNSTIFVISRVDDNKTGTLDSANNATEIIDKQDIGKIDRPIDIVATLQSADGSAIDLRGDDKISPAARPEPRIRCPAGFLLRSGRCFKRRLSLNSPRLSFFKLAPMLRKAIAPSGFSPYATANM